MIIWIAIVDARGLEVFCGSPEQFDDCFGITMERPITEEHVASFCEFHGFEYRLEHGP